MWNETCVVSPLFPIWDVIYRTPRFYGHVEEDRSGGERREVVSMVCNVHVCSLHMWCSAARACIVSLRLHDCLFDWHQKSPDRASDTNFPPPPILFPAAYESILVMLLFQWFPNSGCHNRCQHVHWPRNPDRWWFRFACSDVHLIPAYPWRTSWCSHTCSLLTTNPALKLDAQPYEYRNT